MRHLTLSLLPNTYAVCRLEPDNVFDPASLAPCQFWSVTRTEEELSVVLPDDVALATWQAERGWRCLKVHGPLDLSLIGVLASLTGALTDAGISIFALSTYETDYFFVREADLDKAKSALTACGHVIKEGK